MAKFCSTAILNQSASYIQSNSKQMAVMSTSPANLAACTASTGNNVLARVAMTTADFTIGDSSVSGKKVTVAQKTTIAVTTTGVPAYVVLYATVGTTGIHFWTTCSTAQALTSTANTITVPAWDIHFRDAT